MPLRRDVLLTNDQRVSLHGDRPILVRDDTGLFSEPRAILDTIWRQRFRAKLYRLNGRQAMSATHTESTRDLYVRYTLSR